MFVPGLATALEFSKLGHSVLPVGPNKRPWTPNGVYSASTDPSVFSRWDWKGAACALATGEMVEVLDVDVRGRRPLGTQENPLPGDRGVDGFATLKALGLDWETIKTLTLCASTPNLGGHAHWKPFSGKSRTLGPGVEWFSTGKFVVVPPAPGREWLNDLPIAEAPEELKRIVLGGNGHSTTGTTGTGNTGTGNTGNGREDSSAYLMAGTAAGPLPELPKYLYFKVLRAMPSASPRCRRCALAIINKLRLLPKGRNTGLYTSALGFKELIARESISAAGACMLLVEACKANGYQFKDGAEAVRLTIMSGLGLQSGPHDDQSLDGKFSPAGSSPPARCCRRGLPIHRKTFRMRRKSDEQQCTEEANDRQAADVGGDAPRAARAVRQAAIAAGFETSRDNSSIRSIQRRLDRTLSTGTSRDDRHQS